MPSILITGANRGIGLEYTRQYGEAGWRVFATCRHPTDAVALKSLASHNNNISLHRLDVSLADDIKNISWEIDNAPIDVLLNNAGVYLEPGYDEPVMGAIRYDDWLRTLQVNTLGAVRMTEMLLPNIKRSDKRLVANMSSHMGSIGDIQEPGSYYYRSSKAALNAAMRGMAEDLRAHQVGVLLLHPGGVKTRMGPADGISPEQSVKGLRRIIDNFDMHDSGSFIRYDGTAMAW